MAKNDSTEYWKQQLDRDLAERRRKRREEHFYDFEEEASEAAAESGSWSLLQMIILIVSCVVALVMIGQTIGHLSQLGGDKDKAAQTETVNPISEEVGIGLGEMLSNVKNASDLTTEEKLAEIKNNPSIYPQELRELVVKNPETVDFVFQYPVLKDVKQEYDLSSLTESKTVPLLLQWDTRWGYEAYGSGVIGYTGCGPTCLSMVSIFLTGNAKYTPPLIAQYAEENGFYTIGSGTAWSLMSDGCTAFGIRAHDIGVNATDMIERLKDGYPLICSVGPGDFTDNGHYLVITGYTENGFTINDPNSVERSNMTWSYARLAAQINTMWYYTAD